MDERFSNLDGDLMTEALMMEEFNRLVQETAEMETLDIPTPEKPIELPKAIETPKAVESPKASRIRSEDGTLEESIQLYQQQMKEKLAAYQGGGQKKKTENALVLLDGFSESNLFANRTSGGFFFSYEGYGVAVNPGKNFLKRFHQSGYHVSDIDAVIVTREDQEDSQDLYGIYQLNGQCNSNGSEFHLIRYFIHPSLFRKMGSQLKPQFKQERNNLVSLDLFEERETIELHSKVRFTYMNAEKNRDANLALLFDLPQRKLGYFSKAPYSVESLNLMDGCDVLILGFDETTPKDLLMQEQMEKSLGFMGVFNLCNELGPKVAFIAEHSGQVGDIRMEAVKRLKKILAQENCSTTVFPVESGMRFDLDHLRLQGTNKDWIEMKHVRLIQPQGAFTPLHTLSAEDIL